VKLLREIRRAGIDVPILAAEDIDGDYWKDARDEDLNDMYHTTIPVSRSTASFANPASVRASANTDPRIRSRTATSPRVPSAKASS